MLACRVITVHNYLEIFWFLFPIFLYACSPCVMIVWSFLELFYIFISLWLLAVRDYFFSFILLNYFILLLPFFSLWFLAMWYYFFELHLPKLFCICITLIFFFSLPYVRDYCLGFILINYFILLLPWLFLHACSCVIIVGSLSSWIIFFITFTLSFTVRLWLLFELHIPKSFSTFITFFSLWFLAVPSKLGWVPHHC